MCTSIFPSPSATISRADCGTRPRPTTPTALLFLGVLFGDRPCRRQRIAGAHRRLETRRMLEVRHRRAVKVHPDRRAHDRAGDHAVKDARPETRLARIFVVDVMRIEIADQSGAEHEVRVGDREAGAESFPDGDLLEPLAGGVQRRIGQATTNGGACRAYGGAPQLS